MEAIKFETAKLAKEKGFDLESEHAYDSSGQLDSAIDYIEEFYFQPEDIENAEGNTELLHYLAPYQERLAEWLREEHNLHIGIVKNLSGYYKIHVTTSTSKYVVSSMGYPLHVNYTNALEDGLVICLNNL